MKLKEIKPGQRFKWNDNELMRDHIFLMLNAAHAVNLVTHTHFPIPMSWEDDEVELVDKTNSMYHACRQAFVCGQEKVPWFMVVHALREGLGMDEYKTYTLTEVDYNNHSQLKELVERLNSSRKP